MHLQRLHVDDAFAKATCSLQITVSPRFLPSRRKERGLDLQAKATCFYDDCFFT